eukprot:994329-Alexandrium_andersonii.AAC.1
MRSARDRGSTGQFGCCDGPGPRNRGRPGGLRARPPRGPEARPPALVPEDAGRRGGPVAHAAVEEGAQRGGGGGGGRGHGGCARARGRRA